MEKKFDQSDGKVTYYSKLLVNGFGLIACTHKFGEEYSIQYYRPEKNKKDTRESLIRIVHLPPFHGKKVRQKVHDRICFVIDMKNHPKTRSFHLNLSGISKEICKKCPKCKKYFLPLNHIKIATIDGTGKGIPYKIIDWDLTVNKFIQKLEEGGFFEEFKCVLKYKIY